ncbi:MAG: polysaccharide deacetylase family protein [Gemmatimonadota bacterium]|jgi:peptidoglycan/xylan/chitin deacetylase (PgdA/CDA1 family)
MSVCPFGTAIAQSIEPVDRTVAVTFDDLPATALAGGECNRDALINLTERLLEHVTAYDIPALGLVTERRICDALREVVLPELLSMWLDAGLELGNHTFSHFDLNTTDVATYQDDILRGETVTRPLVAAQGLPLRYFRYPLLHTGPDREKYEAIASFLRARGYTNAPVTIDSQEWVFSAVYVRAKARSDVEMMQRIGDAYVPFMERVFSFFESWSMEVLGYEPPQVLLLHANELNADYFDELAQMMRQRGYRFIPLGQALEDPAYQLPEHYRGPRGLSWLHRWAVTKGLDIQEEPREPDWLAELFRSY